MRNTLAGKDRSPVTNETSLHCVTEQCLPVWTVHTLSKIASFLFNLHPPIRADLSLPTRCEVQSAANQQPAQHGCGWRQVSGDGRTVGQTQTPTKWTWDSSELTGTELCTLSRWQCRCSTLVATAAVVLRFVVCWKGCRCCVHVSWGSCCIVA